MHAVLPVQRANHGGHFRAYGLRGMSKLIDPFLSVDHAWMSAPTFPPHPHAGFSAVSYLFLDSETGMDNRDSIGNRNLIRPGGLHWLAAGKGVVHEEVPAESGKTVHALQIFVHLPPELRDSAPFSLSIEPQDVPVLQFPGAKVRVPAGAFASAQSPLNLPTPVTMLDISLDDDATLEVPIPAGHVGFVMPIFGTVNVGDRRFGLDDLALPVFEPQAQPRTATIRATQGAAKIMFFGGRPISR
ncbi:pirin family protein [Paraburkholderia sp. HP33-1]|uniref:pirin family protein n=1 Tax=Paraburkholderia sp. HP33-1 TaxID=2883243 RepID=UPI001F371699|nr:pirin family protein [Paraburkholderia sp. HP33-1]